MIFHAFGQAPIFGTIRAGVSDVAGNNKLHLPFFWPFTFDKYIPNAYFAAYGNKKHFLPLRLLCSRTSNEEEKGS